MISKEARAIYRKACWPYFVAKLSRNRVLWLYRRLHREGRKFPLKMVGDQIADFCWASFAAYKNETCQRKIYALYKRGESELSSLQAANNLDPKGLKYILDATLPAYGVRKLPIASQLPGHRKLGLDTLRDHKLVVDFNSISIPDTKTYKEYKTSLEGSHETFYRYARFHKKNQKLIGSGTCELRVNYTVHGKVVAESRQRNDLVKHFNSFLKKNSPPVHPKVLEYISTCIEDLGIPRQIRRKLVDCAQRYYSIDKNGDVIKCAI